MFSKTFITPFNDIIIHSLWQSGVQLNLFNRTCHKHIISSNYIFFTFRSLWWRWRNLCSKTLKRRCGYGTLQHWTSMYCIFSLPMTSMPVNILNNYFHSVSFAGYFRWAHITNHSGTFECKNNCLLTEIRFETGMEKRKNYFPFFLYRRIVNTHSVLIWTSGGFAVAFCITKNNFVTISMTWPVWNTKSPFLRPISDWKSLKRSSS